MPRYSKKFAKLLKNSDLRCTRSDDLPPEWQEALQREAGSGAAGLIWTERDFEGRSPRVVHSIDDPVLSETWGIAEEALEVLQSLYSKIAGVTDASLDGNGITVGGRVDESVPAVEIRRQLGEEDWGMTVKEYQQLEAAVNNGRPLPDISFETGSHTLIGLLVASNSYAPPRDDG